MRSDDNSSAVDGFLENGDLPVVRQVLHNGAGRAAVQHSGGLLLLHDRPLHNIPPAYHLLHRQEDAQSYRRGGEEKAGVIVDVPSILKLLVKIKSGGVRAAFWSWGSDCFFSPI